MLAIKTEIPIVEITIPTKSVDNPWTIVRKYEISANINPKTIEDIVEP